MFGWYRARQFEQAILDYPPLKLEPGQSHPTSASVAAQEAAVVRITSLLATDPKLVLHEMPGRSGRLPLGVAVEGGSARLARILLEVCFSKEISSNGRQI